MDVEEMCSGEFPAYVVALAETMPEIQERIDDLWRHCDDDYNRSVNSSHSNYAMSCYTIQKLTFDPKKLKKLGVDIATCDVETLHKSILQRVKKYVKGCLKYFQGCIYPELGTDKGQLHYHGIYAGHVLYLDKFIKWWRRMFGFANYCQYKIVGKGWKGYICPVMSPIYIDKKRGEAP